MEKVNHSINRLNGGVAATELLSRSPRGVTPFADDTGFREKLEALQKPTTTPAPIENPAAHKLKFSNHAVDRMQLRGINFTPEDLGRFESAVAKAAGKGSKNALLISDKAALIVSVKDNAVVTVMDKASLKENVFTNIDSTVVL